MTKEEVVLVLQKLREGKQFSYGSVTAGARYTYFYDPEKQAFAVREQDAYSDAESIDYSSEEEMSEKLQRNFRYDEITF